MVGDPGMEPRMFVQGRIPSQWLVAQMPLAIWATDGALRFVVVGGTAVRELGLEPDKVLGITVYDYFQSTDPAYPPLAAHLQAFQGHTGSYRFEYGGRVFHVTVGPIRHAIGRVVGVVGCATDITALEAEAKGAASRGTLEALPVCVLRLDEQLRVTFANPAALHALGLEDPEEQGLGEVPALAPLEELARRAWHLGEAASGELPVPGQDRVLHWQAALELDPQGVRRAVLLVGWDVTEAVGRLAAAQRESQQWEVWARAAAEVGAARDAHDLAGRLLQRAQQLASAQHGAVALWGAGRLCAQQRSGAVSEPDWERLREHVSVGEAVWLKPVTEEEARALGLTPGSFRKALLVPVRGEGAGGVLLLAWEAQEPQPDDAGPVVRLARLAGFVVSAQARERRLQEKVQMLHWQERLASSGTDAPDPKDAVERWIRAVQEAVRASGVSVYGAQADVWVRLHQVGERQPAATFGAEEGAAAQAARTRRLQRVAPTRGDPAFVGYGAEGVLLPMPGAKPYLLAVESAPDGGFSEENLQLLEASAGQLAALLRWQDHAATHAFSAEAYRRLLDAAPVGVMVLDGSRLLRYANAAAGGLLSCGPQELVGQPVLELFHPDDRTEVAAALSRAYAEPGAVVTFAARLVREAASPVWVEVVASNRLYEPGLTGLVLSLRDVTAQKQAEEAWARRVADLEAVDALGAALRAIQTAGEAAPRMVEHAARLLGADHASLALLDPDADSYTVTAVHGVLSELAGASFPLVGVHGQVLSTGEPFRADQVSDDLALQERGLGPVLAAPLRVADRVLGSLLVARKSISPLGTYHEGDAARLGRLAEAAADFLRRGEETEALQRAYTEVVLSLARAMDAHDGMGPGHGTVVAHWAEAVAQRLGRSPAEAREVRWAALLRNVGKVAIPEEILRKAGPLGPAERTLIERYPVVGEQILQAVPRFQEVAKLVRHHRERWDGTGYPDGLKGEKIPLGSRILAVVDAYTAMTGHRRYRVARSHAEAVEELQRHAGTQFDPAVVRAFVELLEEARTL
ncbi:MAG: hypothetical protein C4304_09370 [candidate division GAL15 bacterium]